VGAVLPIRQIAQKETETGKPIMNGSEKSNEHPAGYRNAMQAGKVRKGVRKAWQRGEIRRAPANRQKWYVGYAWALDERFPDGFYYDTAYICKDCGEEKIWTAQQQKYWFEEKKGRSDSTAVYCPECREKHRQRKEEARQVSAEGQKRKKERLKRWILNGKTP
jgi:predicted RNA-binding Zn-ribbon protein involved in translation (DUF1610 family)